MRELQELDGRGAEVAQHQEPRLQYQAALSHKRESFHSLGSFLPFPMLLYPCSKKPNRCIPPKFPTRGFSQ